MRTKILSIAFAAGLLASVGAWAQAPAGAPAGATGLCKDGTYYTGATKKGACRGHKGVDNWYGAAAPAAAAPAPAPVAPAAPAAAAGAASTASAASPAKRQMPTPAATPAPGGGPGLVWVNSSTKVYHCSGDKWYGTTKSGSYMSEADAKAKGYHGPRGKTCS